MRVLGLSGSLRTGSHNTSLLLGAARLLPDGVEFVHYDELGEIPFYNGDLDGEPALEPVQRLRDAVASADALLVVTPEYNGTLSAVLKNAIDWASRPTSDGSLRGKPAAVLGSSVSPFGAAWAQADLRKTLKIAGARVIGEEEIPVGPVPDVLDEHGAPRDDELAERVRSLLAELSAEAAPVP